MSVTDNDKAGSVAALSGLENTEAGIQTTSFKPIQQLPPDQKVSVEAEPNVGSEPDGVTISTADDTAIDGADLLNRVHLYLRRFVSYPSYVAGVANTLWIGHAHLMDAWFSTPRLAFLSPEPGSGKSRALEITAMLVPRAELCASSSAAFIVRSLADTANRPTICLDEMDAVYGSAGRGNEELRAVLNAGYRQGATVGRCEAINGQIRVIKLQTYGAIAMSGLGNLPDTIMTRSVVIAMRKRAPGESTEAFRPIFHEADGYALRDELELWSQTVVDRARGFLPTLPDGISDRNADLWSPLLTVAELADGRWPEVARDAAVEFVQASKADSQPTLGVQLLADIRRWFDSEDQLPSQILLDRLLSDEEAPWGDLRGKRLDARQLAAM